MHRVLAAGAAAIVLAPAYLRLTARGGRARAVLGIIFAGIVIAAALGSNRAAPAVAHLPPSFDPGSVSGSVSPIRTGWGVHQPIVISFSAPMTATTVEAALQVTPTTPVRLDWDATGSRLYVVALPGWSPGTVYTVTVGPGARSQAGAALAPMAPAIIYVQAAATVTLSATDQAGAAGDRIGLHSGFRLTFSRPVDLASVRDAFLISPDEPGAFTEESGFSADGRPVSTLVWRPRDSLAPDTTYTLELGPSAVDLDGVPLAETAPWTVQTVTRPAVVRFRPRDAQSGIDPNQQLSVRFTEPMDTESTRAAYQLLLVAADGTQSQVDLSTARSWWAEDDTVLIVDPAAALADGDSYVAEVLSSARSRLGVTLSDDPAAIASATFTVAPKATPTPKPTARATTKPAATAAPTTAPTSTTSTAPWLDVEKYYLTLLNCDHTGGWLSSDGTCTGYGSNGHSALILDSYLSGCASRPWAKYLAETNQLYHGDVGGRFAACGYNVYWGENLTWNTYDPYVGAISSVLFFQSEQPYNGGHWVNLLNSRFTHAGVGVWRYNGKQVYVVDFWGY